MTLLEIKKHDSCEAESGNLRENDATPLGMAKLIRPMKEAAYSYLIKGENSVANSLFRAVAVLEEKAKASSK
ncbi:MAG: type II restriction/modification system DNA methylase subunit YeeA [Halocynthiibacter sp.]|jgi:type II restriction/modification system DNA methylase subunit YeeA